MARLLHGDHAARLVSQRVAEQVATLTALKGYGADRRVEGMICQVQEDNTIWQWEADAVCSGDDVLAVTPTDAPSTGRWMRLPGRAMLALTFYATTPTGTNLLTVPSNTILDLNATEIAVRVSRVFTGASTACVGLSSTNHWGHTGIANFAGSCVATLLNNVFSPTAAATGISFQMAPVASGTFNTIETKRLWMKGGDTFRHDVIGAAFGTGVGQWLVACDILQNPGL